MGSVAIFCAYDELKENLEAVENFKGSRLEKLAMLYCKQLGINYKNLLFFIVLLTGSIPLQFWRLILL